MGIVHMDCLKEQDSSVPGKCQDFMHLRQLDAHQGPKTRVHEFASGSGSKIGTQNGTLVNGTKAQNLWSPIVLILTHSHRTIGSPKFIQHRFGADPRHRLVDGVHPRGSLPQDLEEPVLSSRAADERRLFSRETTRWCDG